MSTAKAKLHTEMARAGKKCEYETKQLPPAELPEGRSDIEFNKEDPMFACTLHMPDGYIIRSSNFRRKKDAEQDAALLALQKMGIPYEPGALHATPKELWDGLRRKVCLAFADQMVLSYKPLAEHFRAALQRKGSRSDQVAVIVLTVLDAKITSQCKAIDHLAENNPAHAAALVAMAAAECPSLRLSDDRLWIRRVEPFSPEVIAKLFNDQDGVDTPEESTCSSSNGALSYEAVYISAFTDKDAVSINLTAAPNSYYLDAIAQELDVPDAGHVFMSRQIAKAPDGTRLFWGVREGLPSVSIPDGELVEQVEPVKQHPDLGSKDGPMEALRNPGGQTLRNERASFLVGHAVYGDAILATVGSTWQSDGRCIYEPYTLRSFRKLMLGRTPWGAYKIGRESLLVADLPKNYTCRAHWQGASPKSLLADFCQQHRLPEPQYTYSDSSNVEEGQSESDSKPQIPGSSRQESFHCKVEVSSPGSEAQRFCYQSDEKGFFRSRHDAIQSAALRTVTSYETWCGTGCLRNLTRCKSSGELLDNVASSNGQTVEFEVIEGEDIVGDRPPPGSIVSIDYKVNLISQEGSGCNGSSSNRLEAQEDFKFELVEGAVISQMESCVSKAVVGQTLRFCISAEALGVLFQASSNVGEYQPGWVLEYIVTLLKFEEAMEDRIESSHFSPPLSKQRVEHARTLINDLEAKTLVDLGCGSGCLLEALLREPNTLEHMIGIDISTKALNRGAKTLSATLMKQDAHSIKSVTLYEGSISDLNPRLCCPDLATCIEVVEHMDPEPLSKLGESVLGKLAPRVWLVSTPNIEYNPIIRGLEWDPATNSLKKEFQQQQQQQQVQQVSKEKQMDTEIPNLRNHDHRFEWTRAEFREWASQLAAQFSYEVCYAGVGGDGADDDNSPGFATQIAIFSRTLDQDHDRGPLSASEFRQRLENREAAVASPLKERWQWNVPAAAAVL